MAQLRIDSPAHRLRVLQLRPPGSPPPRVALVLWPLADPVRLPGQLRPSPCRSTPISSKLPGGRCSAACAPAGPQAVRPHSALQSTTDASIWVCKSEGERMCTSWTRRTDAATSYMCCLNWNLVSLVSESCQFHVPVKYVSAARWCELCRATTVLCTLCGMQVMFFKVSEMPIIVKAPSLKCAKTVGANTYLVVKSSQNTGTYTQLFYRTDMSYILEN